MTAKHRHGKRGGSCVQKTKTFLGPKDTPYPVKTFFFQRTLVFGTKKQSNFSEEPYFAFQALALLVLPSLS